MSGELHHLMMFLSYRPAMQSLRGTCTGVLMSYICQCGEAYNTDGTCVKCDSELQTGLIFPVCYDHKVFDKSCVKCYADSLREQMGKDAARITELEAKVKAMVQVEMLKVMKTFDISQKRLKALKFVIKQRDEARSHHDG